MQKFSQLDFEMWGRQATSEYLENNTPLNDSITKIAEDNQLNREHVNRIVEEANNQTYLQKFAAEKDKYIEFPVADAKLIAETRTKLAAFSVGTDNDYALRPSEYRKVELPRSFGGTLKKVGDLSEPTDAEVAQMAYTAKGIQEQFINKMNILSNDFDVKVAELMATNADPKGLAVFAKQNYKEDSSEMKLASYIIGDVKDVPDAVLTDHHSFGLLKEAVALGTEYTEASNTGPDTSLLHDRGARNEKTAGVASTAEEAMWKFLVGAGLLSATAMTGHKLGYEKGKAVQAIKMSPMRKLPAGYKPRG